MRITRAVITAAGRNQRVLPLQTLIDRDGKRKSALQILVEEALRAGVEEICVVICPGDEAAYATAAGEHASRLRFVEQAEPRGYGHAVLCARKFTGDQPFLHLVGDHIFVKQGERGWAEQVVDAAHTHQCSVSAVQPTREGLLPYFGAIGGQRVEGESALYRVERVCEKPTPTQAEQTLLVPGLRAGHYLCFAGIHALTPTVMDLLSEEDARKTDRLELSPVLDGLASRERYYALEVRGQRFAMDVRYGLLAAQLGLALEGQDREEVLAMLCELLARRDQDRVE